MLDLNNAIVTVQWLSPMNRILSLDRRKATEFLDIPVRDATLLSLHPAISSTSSVEEGEIEEGEIVEGSVSSTLYDTGTDNEDSSWSNSSTLSSLYDTEDEFHIIRIEQRNVYFVPPIGLLRCDVLCLHPVDAIGTCRMRVHHVLSGSIR